MLILTRKVGEAITIGDQIKIMVVEVKGSQIRLGIEAPADCRIYREEIYLKVKEQNQLAAFWDLNEFENVVSLFNNEDKEPRH
jgi:carbon storage regulator